MIPFFKVLSFLYNVPSWSAGFLLVSTGSVLESAGFEFGKKDGEGTFVKPLDGQNHQSPIASVQRTRSTLASHSVIPRGTNVKRMNANLAIRITEQRTQGLWGSSFCVSGEDMTANKTLAIRIVAITLASASAIRPGLRIRSTWFKDKIYLFFGQASFCRKKPFLT